MNLLFTVDLKKISYDLASILTYVKLINFFKILCVQEVVPHFILGYYINWATTSWTNSNFTG